MYQNEKEKPHHINKEAFKMLASEIGINPACRKLGIPIPTGKSWAQRGGWKLPKQPRGRPGRALPASTSILHPIADALASSHKDLEDRTRSALARATARAADAAARSEKPIEVSSTAHLRDIAAAAARVFNWDKDKGPHTTYNQLVISPETIERIRRAAEQ